METSLTSIIQTLTKLIEQNTLISIVILIVFAICIVIVFSGATKIDDKINDKSKNKKKNK